MREDKRHLLVESLFDISTAEDGFLRKQRLDRLQPNLHLWCRCEGKDQAEIEEERWRRGRERWGEKEGKGGTDGGCNNAHVRG